MRYFRFFFHMVFKIWCVFCRCSTSHFGVAPNDRMHVQQCCTGHVSSRMLQGLFHKLSFLSEAHYLGFLHVKGQEGVMRWGFVCVCMCVYACVRVHTCVYVDACIQMYVYVCAPVHMYIMCVCVEVCACSWVYIVSSLILCGRQDYKDIISVPSIEWDKRDAHTI